MKWKSFWPSLLLPVTTAKRIKEPAIFGPRKSSNFLLKRTSLEFFPASNGSRYVFFADVSPQEILPEDYPWRCLAYHPEDVR